MSLTRPDGKPYRGLDRRPTSNIWGLFQAYMRFGHLQPRVLLGLGLTVIANIYLGFYVYDRVSRYISSFSPWQKIKDKLYFIFYVEYKKLESLESEKLEEGKQEDSGVEAVSPEDQDQLVPIE